jgi:hypothetical protein
MISHVYVTGSNPHMQENQDMPSRCEAGMLIRTLGGGGDDTVESRVEIGVAMSLSLGK